MPVAFTSCARTFIHGSSWNLKQDNNWPPNKNDYGRISSGILLRLGIAKISFNLISFNCSIVARGILLFTSLFRIDGSYCTRIIVARVILLYKFHCVWKRHCHYCSVDAHAKIASSVACVLTPLLCCLAMFYKVETVQIHATSDWEPQNHCQKLVSRPMRSLEKFTHGPTD